MDSTGTRHPEIPDPLRRGGNRTRSLSNLKRRTHLLSAGRLGPHYSLGDAQVCPADFAQVLAGQRPLGVYRLAGQPPSHPGQVDRGQNIADWVGGIACAQEQNWEYTPPELDEAITTVVLSLDGAYLLMANDGYREAMVGAISLYDDEGERQHTIYFGEAPEYGKASFKARYEQEIARVKTRYPDALYLGIADGAKDNWAFLTPHTDRQLLDFYHVTEYLAKASEAVFPQKTGKAARKQWLSTHCSQLKHDHHAAQCILEELQSLSTAALPASVRDDLEAAIRYFTNNIAEQRMDYAYQVEHHLPIGSGVTEAACKTLVKQRLCGSGMRWKAKGAKVVLSLRALVQTTNRWRQFWDKINQFGVDVSFV